jgi:hypothetical protein
LILQEFGSPLQKSNPSVMTEALSDVLRVFAFTPSLRPRAMNLTKSSPSIDILAGEAGHVITFADGPAFIQNHGQIEIEVTDKSFCPFCVSRLPA